MASMNRFPHQAPSRRAGALGAARETAQDASRYLEEVAVGSSSSMLLIGTWAGEEREEDDMSVQSEKLVLNEDGTFTHRLAHHIALANDLPPGAAQPRRGDCESSCAGRWRLYNIRHFGADVNAPESDREIAFERSADSSALLTEKLVVCGANPGVNGFTGMACRLYCKERDRVGNRQTVPDELEVEAPEPTEADAKNLADATGASVDACLAALFQTSGNTEEAAVLILETSSETAPDASSSALPSVHVEAVAASAEAVAEATGRTLVQCQDALQKLGGKVDDAVVYLLGLPSDDASGEAPANPPASAQSVEPEAITAARLTEITGQSYEKCVGALRKHNGNPEAAAAALLGLEETGEAQSADLDQIDDAEAEAESFEEGAIIAEDDPISDNDNRAVVDFHAQIDAEVDAAMDPGGDDGSSPQSPKRRKT